MVITFPVKTNSDIFILKALWSLGVRGFDVASLGEIEWVRKVLPYSTLHYTNTIKPVESIELAFFKYGVRHYTVDNLSELKKISDIVKELNDVVIHIRIKTTDKSSLFNFNQKFGATLQETNELLDEVSQYNCKLGISFHVGSQCLEPSAFSKAISQVEYILSSTKNVVDHVNIGGGLPANYINSQPLPAK